MAVDLMGGFGQSAAGGFWDDDDGETAPDIAGDTSSPPGYIEVKKQSVDQSLIATDNENKLVNPFDTFKEEQDADPSEYMRDYDGIKDNIRQIERNGNEVRKLTGKYQNATTNDTKQEILDSLDKIISANGGITRKVKDQLTSAKQKNDDYADEHRGSSVAQWRVNQLNTCTRRFKDTSLTFSQELTTFNTTLRDAQRRLIDTVDENKLSEVEKEDMLNDPDRAEAFLQEQFQISDTSDALLDRLAELEDRHQGMLKIEKSIKELQEMWMELNVLITEQQELLDNVAQNVEETKDYVKSATKHLGKAEENQKTTRKLQLIVCVCCIVILVIMLIAMGFGGVFSGS
eukprot:CAMPEP_0202691792 /NCGR_PEP_ID=MMETSP1385-20130828/6406_1 /ASSEMBLY_ACC=CAM_ASM_000861 /TAXON_ID=933848 /ORGANISM="Elphidium margaritaceum" /LENGTH=344 /DNA_ID=CAMNT_0049347245 /DNA_START=18 /DNA_END=1052 /DNA_ORIENTATION=+